MYYAVYQLFILWGRGGGGGGWGALGRQPLGRTRNVKGDLLRKIWCEGGWNWLGHVLLDKNCC